MLRTLSLGIGTRALVWTMSLFGGLAAPGFAADKPDPEPLLPTSAQVDELLSQGQAWLLAHQLPSGSFLPGPRYSLGVTELVTAALANPPLALPASDEHLIKATVFILSLRQPDGGIYRPDEGLAGYGTSLGLLALTAVKYPNPRVIERAQAYLCGIQNQDRTSVCYGGIGFGDEGSGEEDMHNTSLAVAALRASGLAADDAHLQAALHFVESCQNLSTTTKDEPSLHPARPWVTNDGGGVYSPTQNKADEDWRKSTPKDGAPHLISYGGMTHALIDCYLALDIPADDPRVHAALTWVQDHYTFDLNPGMPTREMHEGLFYYFGSAAKTFDLLAQGPFTASTGRHADWRADLFAVLAARAHHVTLPDGSSAAFWLNGEPRWGEGVPYLTTAYVIAALKRIHHQLK